MSNPPNIYLLPVYANKEHLYETREARSHTSKIRYTNEGIQIERNRNIAELRKLSYIDIMIIKYNINKRTNDSNKLK